MLVFRSAFKVTRQKLANLPRANFCTARTEIKKIAMRNSMINLLVVFTALLLSQPLLAADARLTRIIQDGDVEIETFVYGAGRETLS